MKNLIGIVALTGLILAVIASGTAFAQNEYSGTDTSEMHYNGAPYLLWDSSASGSPTVSSGTLVQWANSLTNHDPNNNYKPQIQYQANGAQKETDYPGTLSNGASWTVSSNPPAWGGITVSSSGSYTNIWHYYILGGLPNGVSNQNNNHPWSVS